VKRALKKLLTKLQQKVLTKASKVMAHKTNASGNNMSQR
jgi:hypothetical protein